MNKVLLVGRITKDIEKRSTQNGKSVATFNIAVQRKFKNQDGKYDSDFVNCVAWGLNADFITRYFKKGSKIGIVGSLQSRTYDDKNGNKRYVTEVLVDEVEFVETNKLSEYKQDDDIIEIGLDELNNGELPF